MADIEELKKLYFLQQADGQQGAPIPETYGASKVTPVIDCDNFNKEVLSWLDQVGKQEDNSKDFIYIANWWLGLSGGKYEAAKIIGPDLKIIEDADFSPYTLDGPGGSKKLIDILKEKAKAGVDVRVMGWVSLGVMDVPFVRRTKLAASIPEINARTIQSVLDLRKEPTLEKKALLNIISHAAGAVHSKFLVIGSKDEAVGFTGGLDFQMNRWSPMYHAFGLGLGGLWHDVVAKVEGPAVSSLYDWFRDLWNENLARPARSIRFEGDEIKSHLGGDKLEKREFSAAPKGKHHVQNLRTVPKMNYRTIKFVPTTGPMSFAPDGKFEFRFALKKAIEAARTYIYMEDQSFWAREVFEWINGVLLNRPQLKVILMTSGAADPDDPDFPRSIICNAINRGLLRHSNQGELTRLLSQVRMFQRIDEMYLGLVKVSKVTSTAKFFRIETNLKTDKALNEDDLAHARYQLRTAETFSVIGNEKAAVGSPVVLRVRSLSGANSVPIETLYQLFKIPGITIHSKTTLIDDHWAVIGSANIMRRSLYTDFEHSLSVIDEDDELVRNYRTNLWDDHFRHGVPAHFNTIDEALYAWDKTWGSPGVVQSRPIYINQIELPLAPDEILEGSALRRYNKWTDPDSRETW